MQRKKLEELNLLDDFLFFTMVNDPDVGEEFVRNLLRVVFNRNFGKLKVIPQKVYYGNDTDKHGARLDVYLEETVDEKELLANATIFDIEAEQNDRLEHIKSLPRRTRFYHSTIDAHSLKSGDDYQNLNKVVVLVIMPFDPFEFDHMIYTLQRTCLEIPDMEYEDGSKTLFLYTKGSKGTPTKELREFLNYMEDTSAQNVKNHTLEKIHHMVEDVKHKREVSREYMKIFEREKIIREDGIQEGRLEGIQEGRMNTLLSQIQKKLAKGQSLEMIAAALEEDIEVIQSLAFSLEHPNK